MTDLAPSSTFVLEQLPTAVVCLDADGRVQLANATARQLFGCSDPEELIGMPIRTYVQFMRLGGSGQEECIRDDGSSFPLEYESAAGETGGTIVTLRDVSQRAAAERRKDELISLVSHELRTPLTSIRSVLGLLVSGLLGQLNDRGQAMVHIGISNADRLVRLVTDLLDLERINSDQSSGPHELCRIDRLMRQAAESVRALAAEARVTLEVASLEEYARRVATARAS